MPGKHVHFVDVPSTPPSATFSTSTLTSSPGPSTPPQVYYSPPSSTKSTRYVSGQVSLNPILARALSGVAPLSWDLSEPAESARPTLPHAPSRLTDAIVCEPATHPPLPSLAIICEHLPWTITITPTPNAIWAAPYVTVGDVLHTLYRALRLGVTEYELTAHEPALQDRVRDAYVRRYRRISDPRMRESEKAKFIKRVDFLCDRRVFVGLSPVPGGLPAKGLSPGAVWALHVARR